MTFADHFTALMKARGQPDKQITLALVAMGDQANRELSELEAKMMTELADIVSFMPTSADEAIKAQLKGKRN